MAELFKRLFIIAGIGILFVFTSMLVGEGVKYGARGPKEIGFLEYMGLKKMPSPLPVAREVNYLNKPVSDYEQIAVTPTPESTPTSSPSPATGEDTNSSNVSQSKQPAESSQTNYYYDTAQNKYIEYQAPRDTF